jgi:hypothetical protein
MLTADVRLVTCQSVLDSLERNLADDCLPETKAALHINVQRAGVLTLPLATARGSSSCTRDL